MNVLISVEYLKLIETILISNIVQQIYMQNLQAVDITINKAQTYNSFKRILK